MDQIKIKVAVCGPVDAGKSSLIGVLNTGQYDDGRGLARSKILKHKHELETGRTSNITFNSIVYEKNKDQIDVRSIECSKSNFSVPRLFDTNTSSKVVSLIDLAGHEKYFKTTLFGVAGMYVDYGLIIIGANIGRLTKLTREHIQMLRFLKVPIIIVITKVDLAPENVYKDIKNELQKFITRHKLASGFKFFNQDDDFEELMNFNSDFIPIISVSNKTGMNINKFHNFMFNLNPRVKWDSSKVGGSILFIDHIYKVKGTGTVVSGTLKGNNIKVKQKLWIGPFSYGEKFVELTVRSLHNSIRENVEEVKDNETNCLAIKATDPKITLDKKTLRKGMIITDNPKYFEQFVSRTFNAEIKVLHHSTTMSDGYTPVIHCGPIRQSARMKLKEDEHLRTGDTKEVEFEFQFRPEFIEPNTIFFFRDGLTKGVGKIKN